MDNLMMRCSYMFRQVVLIYSCSVFVLASIIVADRIEAHLERHHFRASAGGATSDWCLSQDQYLKNSFVWTISNYSLRLQNTGESINSSIFPAGAHHRYKWQLLAYPRGDNQNSADYLSLGLVLFEHEPKDEIVLAKYKFSILTDNHEIYNTMDRGTLDGFVQGTSWVYSKFARDYHIKQAKLLPDDKLTILCEVDVLTGSCQYTGQLGEPPAPESRLPDDLAQLFANQKFSDITIVVGDREFRAHKAILVARSAVFAAMFEHDMRESQLNRVEVNDIESYVFEELLRFIYTGKSILEDTPEPRNQSQKDGEEAERNVRQVMAVELLKASDKYQLDRLKIICEHRLVQDISVDSVVNILLLAYQYNATVLKDKAVDFMGDNAAEVPKTDAWNSLVRENPALVGEILDQLAHRALGISRLAASIAGGN